MKQIFKTVILSDREYRAIMELISDARSDVLHYRQMHDNEVKYRKSQTAKAKESKQALEEAIQELKQLNDNVNVITEDCNLYINKYNSAERRAEEAIKEREEAEQEIKRLNDKVDTLCGECKTYIDKYHITKIRAEEAEQKTKDIYDKMHILDRRAKAAEKALNEAEQRHIDEIDEVSTHAASAIGIFEKDNKKLREQYEELNEKYTRLTDRDEKGRFIK